MQPGNCAYNITSISQAMQFNRLQIIEDAMTNLIGQQFGQYRILGMLGRGGMATVFRAQQTSMDREVAIKVIKPDLVETEEFVERFRREARTIASLGHPHILKVFDYGQQDDMVYLVMELVKGGSLADLIRRGSLPLEGARKTLEQVASALDYAHAQGIIHRDLKPQNVLLDSTGNAVLTDFGIAKLLNETTALTQSGMAMGTPAYMPPEQWQGRSLDARADVYSLGIMLFEMLTGQLPFNADTPPAMMYLHLQEPPPSIVARRADLPAGTEQVLQKALTKDRDKRFASAGALSSAFRASLEGKALLLEPIDATQPAPTASVLEVRAKSTTPPGGAPTAASVPARSRLPLVLAAVVVVVVIGIGLALASRSSGGGETAATQTALTQIALQVGQTQAALSATPTRTNTVPNASQTPKATLTASVAPTETANAQTLAAAMAVERATQTAIADAAVAILASSETAEAQATAWAVASFTKTPSATPTATATFTASPVPPTKTDIPMSTLTATAVSPTTAPVAIALASGVTSKFRDDFDGNSLSDQWGNYGKRPKVADGNLIFEGDGTWDNGVGRGGIGVNEGALLLFQHKAGEMNVRLDSGDWESSNYREWVFNSSGSTWEVAAGYGKNAVNYTDYTSVSLRTGTWYYLLLRVGTNGRFFAHLWEAQNPTTYLLAENRVPPGGGWTKSEWDYTIAVNSGSLSAASYEELRFPANFEMPTKPPQLAGPGNASRPETPNQTSQAIYTVQPFDSLGSIAYRFSVTEEEIKRANGLSDPFIRAGQQLKIPGLIMYVVASGDTLAGIAQKFHITVEELQRANEMTGLVLLQPGLLLMVPKQ